MKWAVIGVLWGASLIGVAGIGARKAPDPCPHKEYFDEEAPGGRWERYEPGVWRRVYTSERSDKT